MRGTGPFSAEKLKAQAQPTAVRQEIFNGTGARKWVGTGGSRSPPKEPQAGGEPRV